MNIMGIDYGLTISSLRNRKENKDNNIYDDIKIQERKDGIRKPSIRGFDVINQHFFVIEEVIDLAEERVIDKDELLFDSFDDYYVFLKGDIYTNACYYMFPFTDEIINKYNIDIKKINFDSLIDYTFEEDNLDNELSKRKEEYDIVEEKKEANLKWLEKILKCKTLDELESVIEKFKKCETYDIGFKRAFIYYFVQNNPVDAFDIIMDSINNRGYFKGIYMSPTQMCLLFSPDVVLEAVNYEGIEKSASKSTKSRYLKQLKMFANNINSKQYYFESSCYFDKNTNYFVVREVYDMNDIFPVILERYFPSIEELKIFLKGDLSNCDFSYSLITKEDVKGCKYNNKTLFSLNNSKLDFVQKKCYKNNKFIVSNDWFDSKGNSVYQNSREFDYFFDFVHYLKNDLSNSDLLSCNGLININRNNDIDFNNAKITSAFLKKLGIDYEKTYESSDAVSFDDTIVNEKETQPILYERKELSYDTPDESKKYTRISYVSDIHLSHRLKKCETENDVILVIRETINGILEEYPNYLLIGGDVSSDFRIYKLFVEELSRIINEDYRFVKVFFVLGNHELWDFFDEDLNEIVNTYRELLLANKMYLIHNNMYVIENDRVSELSFEKIENCTIDDLRNELRQANLILFGGIGFSGYNEKFNADCGIYRFTINREREIIETKIFEDIYMRMCEYIRDKNVIVFTHMPKKDWSMNKDYVDNWVYVSGHTHRNYYYDDGVVRVYSDNQLGYKYKQAFSKSFYIEYDYDLFSDYKDGIYHITKEKYIAFYRGKNIMMDYTRDGIIYMLKKNGYYCFIKPSSEGRLSILNGGALKSLDRKDIEYYYDNMDYQISFYKEPLDKYSALQRKIANIVKQIGGDGSIHGSIVDIDFYNHIYVNPFDGTISGYYATDIINKFVYKNIPSLLEANLPNLFINYQKLIAKNEKDFSIINSGNKIDKKSMYYPNTDIYRASREIKKMQRLNHGILTLWYDSIDEFKTMNNQLYLK